MEYGRMVKATLPSSEGGDDEAVLYVVDTEDPDEAMKLIGNTVAVGSVMEVVGRVSHQLLDALKLGPGQVTRV
jgi:hypothetical protein